MKSRNHESQKPLRGVWDFPHPLNLISYRENSFESKSVLVSI